MYIVVIAIVTGRKSTSPPDSSHVLIFAHSLDADSYWVGYLIALTVALNLLCAGIDVTLTPSLHSVTAFRDDRTQIM